ncbi:hypothetical protein FRB90_000385 [Tulasnella sp. 427]|nr:hypothetical protein FRB90_000385 [Tulasnella sp. 427]
MKSRPEKAFSGVCDISALVLHPDPVDLSGGFADVYKANHPELGFLALKRPRGACQPGSIGYRHLEKEGAIWKNLEHPNVLKFLGIHRDSQTIYLVSPYMENGTVVQYLRTHPDADHFRARFVLDLARGLSYLHSNGIVHGDIKGSNMLVSSAIEGVVADFGLAKVVDTRTGTSQRGVGSTRWQSPEMLLHGESRTFKSDVYAFGMTTYEIITGSIPFGPEFPDYAIVSRISNKDRPLPLPRLSSHGYAYTNEWTVAQAAWHEEPPRRPDMNRVIMVLQAPQEHKLRIRVECDTALKGSGYISRELDGPSGSQVVTQNVDKALVVVWDCDSPELSAFSMIVGPQ